MKIVCIISSFSWHNFQYVHITSWTSNSKKYQYTTNIFYLIYPHYVLF